MFNLSNNNTYRIFLGSLHKALIETYPNDWHVRCYSAASALTIYLDSIGISTNIKGGFMHFPLSSRNARFQGWASFDSKHPEATDPHVWVRTNEHEIIDISPYLYGKKVGACETPALWWHANQDNFDFLAGYWESDMRRVILPLQDDLTNKVVNLMKRYILDGVSSEFEILFDHHDLNRLYQNNHPWAVGFINSQDEALNELDQLMHPIRKRFPIFR